jgi:hypothetical protein
MTSPHDEPVGSVGDEAAKLLGALADWAGDHVNGRVGDRVREVNDHIATGDAECLYCPICRTVHAVREASPEVKAQLAQAASTFLQAAAGLLAAAGAAEPPSSRVQHIDLDAETTDDSNPDEDAP